MVSPVFLEFGTLVEGFNGSILDVCAERFVEVIVVHHSGKIWSFWVVEATCSSKSEVFVIFYAFWYIFGVWSQFLCIIFDHMGVS